MGDKQHIHRWRVAARNHELNHKGGCGGGVKKLMATANRATVEGSYY